jgi:glycogen debranching enzyme
MSDEEIIEVKNKFYISTNSAYADSTIKVLNHSDTFGIFDRWGDVVRVGEAVKGIYHDGTRFISESELRINNIRPLLLSSSVKEENDVLSVDLTNEPLPGLTDKEVILKGALHIQRSKFLRKGACFEKITFKNFSVNPFEFKASLSLRADFLDIFEIRGMTRHKRGEIFEMKHLPDNSMCIRYKGLDDIVRTTKIFFSRTPDSWHEMHVAIYNFLIGPGEEIVIEISFLFGIGETPENGVSYDESRKLLEAELHQSRKEFAHIYTSNEQLNHWIKRSQSDLISLLAQTPGGRYPYAGVPWYNTAFGRDGIITARQTLWAAPYIAQDVLLFLAENQATVTNNFQDAEPGKIMHEMRGGEMVETKEIPFKKYYGSVDATPLFIMLAGAYYKRTNDIETIKRIWKNILAALTWIKEYGDPDHDGFTEYTLKSENGLINQGWKDSFDSISDENGTLAKLPVALCEVQGYVYDAKVQASMLAAALGENDLASELKEEAAALKKHFHDVFWDENLKTYIIALDGDKKPCRINASNAGHCLFTGIADESVAPILVETLMRDDMFSGWGIRTLSSKEKRYNPMSYHNGSVWPHDVALIAHGFARYGFKNEAMQLTASLFDASLYIDLQRLPELFCGFDRRKGEGPTAYPVACSPQAWSVGAVYMLINSCLHMEINALEKKVFFKKPFLPAFMDNVLITGLKLGECFVSLELHNYKNEMGLIVKNNSSDWEIMLIK